MSENNVKLFFNKLDYLKNSSDRIIIRSNIVKKFLGNLNNVTILDIGCGDGSLSLPFLNESNHLTLVDISNNMLAKVKDKIPEQLANNIRLVNDSFEAINDKDQFDVIICVGVIAHVPAVDALFAKISAVLKSGGILIIETTPNPYPIGKLLFPYYFLRSLLLGHTSKYNKNRLKVNELMAYADNMGLECLQTIRYSFPLPGMSHWPQSLKLRYTLFTLNNPLISRFGSEHIFLFKKIK
jgi:2-polyprenyl-3-methyl-5-hydroxy-6-metoxy-1,4-benzoquinol methylase